MADSIFTKIIKREIPSYKIYEDDKIYAFLDTTPFSEGHTLVVPKQEHEHVWDLDKDLYTHLMMVAKIVANRQREVLKCPRVAMFVDGFGVPDHAHIHVLPLYRGLETTIKEGPLKDVGQEAMKAIAEKLAIKDNK